MQERLSGRACPEMAAGLGELAWRSFLIPDTLGGGEGAGMGEAPESPCQVRSGRL
jgi:hypothetical protein